MVTWAEMWAPGDTSPKAAADQAWRLRWQGEYERARGKWPMRCEQAADEPLFTKDTLRKLDWPRSGPVPDRSLFWRL